ncbi:site-specific recombinase XerD [Ruminiclostridium sufflavum DSM 19573]|uniref:Site-specific recombinase XerD n=1 Tax=Ruminiclostridium sufflavum DSM 19573 TaxID=1121337 RepID=A0A318XGA9_9FIRM|nr:tyrosine-type recombinase/integrase [Ruminiclostridium sufflavum]PYG84967.1 site-specific recombinase XerD [Ruminiclostridium sufflavum DSM 19573]
MTLQETALQAVQTMIDKGYSPFTAWNEYETVYAPIIRVHEKHNIVEFNTKSISEYVSATETRFKDGKISYGTFHRLIAGAERLLMFQNGNGIRKPKHGNRVQIGGHFGIVLDNFIANSHDWGKTVKPTAISELRQHFDWLLKNGCDNLENVTGQILRNYLIYCSEKYCPATLAQLKGRLKRSYTFFLNCGYIAKDFSNIFSFKVAIEKKILRAVPQDEIAAVLKQIDRSLPRGKRDYAIILLGIVTGLRACDIAALKLSDIDWRTGEIHILQKKTRVPLALPLTQDVGAALKDYILNGRISPIRKVIREYEEVFISVKAPYAPLSHYGAIGGIYALYKLKAGLKSGTFHDLRRAIGKNMVTAEIPVSTVSQVLGHGDLDSTKQYISLDSIHLKECALNFQGIVPKGGAAE